MDSQSKETSKNMSSRILENPRLKRREYQKLDRERESKQREMNKIFDLCDQSYSKLDVAAAALKDALTSLHALERVSNQGIGRSVRLSRRLRLNDLLNTTRAAQGQITRVVGRARSVTMAQKESLDELVNFGQAFE